MAERHGMTSPEYVYFYFSRLPTAATYTPWIPSERGVPQNVSEDEYAKREIFYSLKHVGV